MEASTRVGNWLGLGNGRMFWPLDPRAEEVHIEDIAHALSNVCRWGGRVSEFYSVAQHSVHVAQIVERAQPKHALRALLHDAAEAYLGDIATPIKRMLHVGGREGDTREFMYVEADLMECIHEALGLPLYVTNKVERAIHDADALALATEARDLMGGLTWPGMVETNEPTIEPLSPRAARTQFLSMFRRLTAKEKSA